MDAKALPNELLDEHELHERYRSIDLAASEVRDQIKKNLKKERFRAIPVKLKIESAVIEHA